MLKDHVLDQAIDVLRACLSHLTGHQLRIEDAPVDAKQRPDLVAMLEWQGQSWRLLVEVKGEVYPQLARQAIEHLKACSAGHPDAYPVLVATYVSPAVADTCVAHGVGYADLAGNCQLHLGAVHIERAGQPNAAPRQDRLRSLFSPRAERVVRVLLASPLEPWTLTDLAAAADVSIAHVHNVKTLLIQHEWAEAANGGVRVSRPGDLLDAWASREQRPRQIAHGFVMRELGELESAVADICGELGRRWAFSEFSAAIRYAPMVRYVRATAYVDGDVTEILERLGARSVTSGANLKLVVPRDEGVFHAVQEFEEAQAVAPVQAYVDLFDLKGRGEEAADELRQKVIEPTW